MKVAYVHVLPVEYYPPATNALRMLAANPKIQLSAWTSDNRKNRLAFECEHARMIRPKFVDAADNTVRRLLRCFSWHWQCARGLQQLKPDAVISIEPHSALAIWIYYRLLRGKARLFIHHHEYYTVADYERGGGMRIVNLARKLEQRDLMPRAEWISQTNENRLRFLQRDNPAVEASKFKVWPNYPPRSWKPERSAGVTPKPLRLLYLGSASFHDTYIREIAEWAARYPGDISLMISGYNVEPTIWEWLKEKNFPNITSNPAGWTYEELPRHLADYDVGLILYRGNTVNFVYNAPNKLFEYWAAGLEVWFPAEMKQISELARLGTTPPLREMDYTHLEGFQPPTLISTAGQKPSAEYSCESAMTPLLELLLS